MFAPESKKTTNFFPESIICAKVGQSLAFKGVAGLAGVKTRSFKPDWTKRGSQMSFTEAPSGLVKMNVNTSLGLASMKDLTVLKKSRTGPPSRRACKNICISVIQKIKKEPEAVYN